MADTIDLTGEGDEEAGPSRPPPRRARSPSLDLLVVEALPCAVCAQPAADGPALGGCKHSVCGACLRAACRRVSLAWPPPGGVGAAADAAFRAFVCPLSGCGQPLSDAALASALEPQRHAQALRFLAAAADSWLESEGARDCPHCGARSSVGREAPKPAPPPPPPPKGKGKAAPRTPPPGACRDCQRPVRNCGECGEGDTAASLAAGPRPPHACDPARLRALALLRALRELRAAHWAPGGGGCAAGGGKARKRPAAAAGAGTGYGGAAGAPSKAQRAAQAKAAAVEASADGAARAALTAACAALEGCWGGRAGGQARAPPVPRAALCHAALAPCLAALLRSASLFDSNRSASLRAALRLVGLLGARPPLLPLLCLPSAAAAPVPPPGEPLWDGGEAEAAEEEEGASVSDLLRALAEQAGALLEAGGGGGDELAALAREVRDTDEALRARARAAGGGLLRRRRPPPPPARGAGAGAGAQAAAEAEYEAVMSKQTYDSSPLLATHYFRREAAAMGAGLGGEAGKQRMRRIAREAAAMRTGLPCHFGSCVAVRVDEERSDVLQVLIVPHRDTPYGNAVFVFDVLLPADYPSSPPRVQLLTTGGGKVRFNPNLYACGKVCLSLLGTWAGPGWQPGSSTLLQVLVSIQSLIFVEKPWFNEPGYEKTEGTPQGEAQSAAYCAQVAADSLAWALLPALRQPPPAFHAFLVQHFRRKHDDIAAMLRNWQAKARGRRGPCEAAILVHARSCEEALQRYAPRAHAGPVETVSLL